MRNPHVILTATLATLCVALFVVVGLLASRTGRDARLIHDLTVSDNISNYCIHNSPKSVANCIETASGVLHVAATGYLTGHGEG